MQLVIAEKPSVARDLARVLGVRAAGGGGAFEGERCVITWCIGHLVELVEPATYDPAWKAWRLSNLPMLPEAFRLQPSKHAEKQLRVVTALLKDRRFEGVVNACDAGREGELIFRYVYQYASSKLPVRRLWISSLTDEAIRKGFASLRPGADFVALADAARSRSEADWLVGMNATRAVTARGRDAGHTTLYSIGRVQTPTLAMLVEREQELRAFVPKPYWEVRAALTTEAGEGLPATWRDGAASRLASAELADRIVARDMATGGRGANRGEAVVERVKATVAREPAPQLFDLTSLQRTANRRYGFSAQRTLELAQALYERHKIVTYPRTDSRHLSADVAAELAGPFTALAELPAYTPFAQQLLAHPPRPGRRIVDDSKVRDHHAIIPTGKAIRLDALDRDEARLFDLIARRFLGAFFPDAEFAATEVWIRVDAAADVRGTNNAGANNAGANNAGANNAGANNAGANNAGANNAGANRSSAANASPAASTAGGRKLREANDGERETLLDALPPPPDRYLTRGRVRLVAGWQDVAGIEPRRESPNAGSNGGANSQGAGHDDDDRNLDRSLPKLVEGQRLTGTFESVAKRTTPPPRYTEATLLAGMETAGRRVSDEALREAMKDTGLGTPATRASIIETLLRRGYIARDRQNLVATDLGINLIVAIPVASLASPELTGNWEARLAAIARGTESRAAFMADIEKFVTGMVDIVRGAAPPVAPPSGSAPPPAWSKGGRGGKSTWKKGGSRGSSSSSRGTWTRTASPSADASPRSPSSGENGSRTSSAPRSTANVSAETSASPGASSAEAPPAKRPRAKRAPAAPKSNPYFDAPASSSLPAEPKPRRSVAPRAASSPPTATPASATRAGSAESRAPVDESRGARPRSPRTEPASAPPRTASAHPRVPPMAPIIPLPTANRSAKANDISVASTEWLSDAILAMAPRRTDDK